MCIHAYILWDLLLILIASYLEVCKVVKGRNDQIEKKECDFIGFVVIYNGRERSLHLMCLCVDSRVYAAALAL